MIRTDRTRHLLDSSIYPQHKKYNIILFSIKKKLNLSNISSKKIILSRLYLSNQCGTQLIRAITRSRVEMTRIQVLQSLISFAVPYYRKENLVGTGEGGEVRVCSSRAKNTGHRVPDGIFIVYYCIKHFCTQPRVSIVDG